MRGVFQFPQPNINSEASPDGAFLLVDNLSLLLFEVEGAVAGIVGSDTLVAAAVGGTGEGSALLSEAQQNREVDPPRAR